MRYRDSWKCPQLMEPGQVYAKFPTRQERRQQQGSRGSEPKSNRGCTFAVDLLQKQRQSADQF
jgi:hypothetical protein